jgi:membrane protease YdiL (CAAX protease family)
MRNYLKYHSPGVQFVVFMGLAAGMFLIYRFIAQVFFGEALQSVMSGGQNLTPQALNQFRWAQLLSSIMTFVIPAYLYAYLSDEHPLAYLGVKKNTKMVILFAVLFLFVAVEPFAVYMGQINQHVNFGPDQQKLEDIERVYENAMNNFVKMRSPMDLFVNLFIVALVPAVSEELFFRASLQNILERWTRSPWVAIIISSIVFALLHLTIFKFLGILTLGVALGTLFYITRNILYNIFFHFVNNSISLLVAYYASRNETARKLSGDEVTVSITVAAVSLIVTLLLFVAIRRRSPREPLQASGNPTHFDIE